MQAKNVHSSPAGPTSGERTQDVRFLQSKSQVSSTIVNDSPLAEELAGKASQRNVHISPTAKPIKDAEARIISTSPKP